MAMVHISGWVDVTEPNGPSGPVDPGFGGGRPPVDPGYGHWGGWSPADPGYGKPGWGGRPDNSLPIAPVHPGNKPPGRPVIPPHPANRPPSAPAHPWIPGHWEPIDPGFGKPPIFAFFPVDPGWGINEAPPPVIGGGPATPPARPDNSLPKPPHIWGHPGGGQWVPTDPGYGKPVRPCPPVGGIPHPPIWAWVPDLPDFGGDQTTVTLYPTTGNCQPSGSSVSVNVTVTPAGATWEVDAASVPAWVKATPTGPQAADVNLMLTAAANTTGAARSAIIKVSGASFTLSQAAV